MPFGNSNAVRQGVPTHDERWNRHWGWATRKTRKGQRPARSPQTLKEDVQVRTFKDIDIVLVSEGTRRVCSGRSGLPPLPVVQPVNVADANVWGSLLGRINEIDPRPCPASGRGNMTPDMTSRRVTEKSRRWLCCAAGSTRHTPPRESVAGRPRAGKFARRRRAPTRPPAGDRVCCFPRRNAKPFRVPI